MKVFDCWTEEDLWLTLGDICSLMRITPQKNKSKSEYESIVHELTTGFRGGVFERKLVNRKIKVRSGGLADRKVYAYKPKSWVLHSVCNGYYKARVNEK